MQKGEAPVQNKALALQVSRQMQQWRCGWAEKAEQDTEGGKHGFSGVFQGVWEEVPG